MAPDRQAVIETLNHRALLKVFEMWIALRGFVLHWLQLLLSGKAGLKSTGVPPVLILGPLLFTISNQWET